MTIAALFVEPSGAYADLADVEIWTAEATQQTLFGAGVRRDARAYDGPHAVVAHPPCARWCRLAGLVEKRWGHRRGEDDGCFAAALRAVRAFGGVLEHPAWSGAWDAFDLPRPLRSGGWQRGACGGWACHVEQHRYGHEARKATWLYAFGLDAPPEMRWGSIADREAHAWVSWCGNATRGATRRRLSKSEAIATPRAFRDALLAIARSVRVTSRATRAA